jgi:hypothetical protein
VDVPLARAESARRGGGALVAPVLGGGAFAGRHRALAAVSPGQWGGTSTRLQCSAEKLCRADTGEQVFRMPAMPFYPEKSLT